MTLDHVGIAVESIARALPLYRDRLGLALEHEEELASQKVKVAFLRSAGAGASVELLESLGEGGAVGRFIAVRGPGLHHVAFKVQDIREEMLRLEGQGLKSVETTGPRAGARGHKVCFYHPRDCLGTLVELIG